MPRRIATPLARTRRHACRGAFLLAASLACCAVALTPGCGTSGAGRAIEKDDPAVATAPEVSPEEEFPPGDPADAEPALIPEPPATPPGPAAEVRPEVEEPEPEPPEGPEYEPGLPPPEETDPGPEPPKPVVNPAQTPNPDGTKTPGPEDAKNGKKTGDDKTKPPGTAQVSGRRGWWPFGGKKKDEEKTPAADPDDPDAKVRELLAKIEEQKKKVLDSAPPPEAGAGSIEKRDLKAEMVLRAMRSGRAATLRGRVVDPVTGKVVPAFLTVTDVADRCVGAEVADRGFWTEGSFEVKVLPGKVRYTARTGRFCIPTEDTVDLAPGETKTLVVNVARSSAFNAFVERGWHPADFCARPLGGATPRFEGACDLKALRRVARAQGIAILGAVGPYQPGKALTAKEAAAQCRGVSAADFVALPAIAVGNHPIYGSAFALGLDDWRDLPPPAMSVEALPVDLFEEVRSRGGMVFRSDLGGSATLNVRDELISWVRPLEKFYGDARTARVGLASALPLETVIGPTFDGIELDGSEECEDLWMCLLNLGYRVPALAATNACLQRGEAPEVRAFVRVDGKPTAEKVLKAVRSGRMTLSFGPAVLVSVPERELHPGDATPADGAPCSLRIEAYSAAERGVQLDKIEVLRNGKAVHTLTADEGLTQLREFRYPIRERANAWYMVRVTERGPKALRRRAALSNPIYFEAPAAARPVPPVTHLTGSLADSVTSLPLQGRIVVLAPDEPTRNVEVKDGKFDLRCPSASTLIVEADGYRSQIHRVFLLPPILERIRRYHVDPPRRALVPMARPAAYEGMRLLLAEQRLHARLERLPAEPPARKEGAPAEP